MSRRIRRDFMSGIYHRNAAGFNVRLIVRLFTHKKSNIHSVFCENRLFDRLFHPEKSDIESDIIFARGKRHNIG